VTQSGLNITMQSDDKKRTWTVNVDMAEKPVIGDMTAGRYYTAEVTRDGQLYFRNTALQVGDMKGSGLCWEAFSKLIGESGNPAEMEKVLRLFAPAGSNLVITPQ